MRFSFHLFTLCLAVAACSDTRPVKFTDVAQRAGIDFRYTFGDTTYQNILESSGSGVSVFDYDGDGQLDLYLLNGTYLEDISEPEGRAFRDTPNRLYRNNGDGTFAEVSERAGLDDRHWSMAAGAFDYDGDGDVDVYLANYGPNVFYLNNGDGTFSDATDALGLRGPSTLNGRTKWSVGVAFWDYDVDGRVDLMLGNFLAFDPDFVDPAAPHLMPHPASYRGQASLLYRQQRDGSFREVTAQARLLYPDSKCMGLTVFDFDGDGDLDLFQGNDHQLNFLFRNEGDGTFREVAEVSGVAVNDQGMPTGSMHGTLGDVDGDGLIDLFVTDLRYGALYRNLGGGMFDDITEQSGVAAAFRGKGAWGAALFDFDNDGDLDLFSANGTAEALVLQPPLLLANDGSGHFHDVGPELGDYFAALRSGRGAAIWDYDNDGDLDIAVSHVDLQATAALLRNDGGNRNHWLGLNVGGGGPASAIGATVSVTTATRTQLKVNQWATSYLSYNDPRMLFGLGADTQVKRLEIHWPNGEREVLEDIPADRYVTLVQAEGIRDH